MVKMSCNFPLSIKAKEYVRRQKCRINSISSQDRDFFPTFRFLPLSSERHILQKKAPEDFCRRWWNFFWSKYANISHRQIITFIKAYVAFILSINYRVSVAQKQRPHKLLLTLCFDKIVYLEPLRN